MKATASIMSSFAWGFYSAVKTNTNEKNNGQVIKNFLRNPLTSIFTGTIIGFVYGYGGSLLHSIIPFPYQLVIPICAVGAIVADIAIDEKNEK